MCRKLKCSRGGGCGRNLQRSPSMGWGVFVAWQQFSTWCHTQHWRVTKGNSIYRILGQELRASSSTFLHLQSPHICIVQRPSREEPELLLQPCLCEKIIMPSWYSCCVLVRGPSLSIPFANDPTPHTMIKGRNGLTRFHLARHSIPACILDVSFSSHLNFGVLF